MRLFRDMPVRRKLKAISMVSGGLALLAASAAFVAYDYFSLRAAFSRRVEALAEIVGKQTTAALSFHDAKASEEILDALTAEGSLVTACVYDEKGRLFASYRRAGASRTPPAAEPPTPGVAFADGHLTVTLPILLNRQKIGATHLVSDLTEASRSLWTQIAIVSVVLAASLLLAYFLTSRLGTIVTGPILHLAETAAAVTEHRNYAVRARSEGRDELGRLIDGFNEMLGQIERRDRDLERARDELELRVAERTSDLIRVNGELQKEASDRREAQESLRTSEERFRQLVESSPDGIVIASEGKFSFLNRGAVQLFGAAGADDLRGTAVADRLSEASRSEVGLNLRRAAEGHQASPLVEERIVRLDGKAVDVEMVALPFSGTQDRAAQLVIRDITKRKELDRMKSEFISTVSHELRTPLTSIRGSLKLIVAGVTGSLAPKTMAMVTIAHDSCERLIRLVNDILDMQKMETGKITIESRALDPAVPIEQAIEANRAYANTFGVTLRFENRAPGTIVLGDGARIIQVMTNLLSNAVKFSPPKGRVDVTLACAGDRARISVADKGPGIPEAFRARIFQKFSQADSSDTRSRQGTGLGLSITRAIVERLGGTITFESTPGAGTTFVVELPLHHELRAQTPPPPPDRPRILICEDDAGIASVLQANLEAAGLAAEIAGTAREARAMLEQKTYAAMTLDYLLPDQDGAALAAELSQLPATRDLPIIVVSAYLDEARRRFAGGSARIVDWLEKPMDEERLKTTLKWLVRSGRKTWRILHIEDDPHQLRAVRDSLHEFAAVCPVATVADARVLTKDGDFDLVILDPAVKDAGSPGREPAFPRPDGSLLPLVLHAADAGGLPGSPSSESLALLVRAVRTHLEKQDRSAVEAPRSGVRV